MNIIKQSDDFLHRHGMHPDLIEINKYSAAFIADMKAGLSDQPSSLKMLPTYISAHIELPDEGEVTAIDIGGTKLRIAAVGVRNKKIQIDRIEEFPVPGRENELTAEEFFRSIASHLKSFMPLSNRIGICFSHPVEMLSNKEGRIISFSKEIKVRGAEGVEIIKSLEKALKEEKPDTQCPENERTYVLLNDTTGVLLAGSIYEDKVTGSELIGFVLGTGTNMAYEENISAIRNLSESYDHKTMLINTESGYFMGIPAGVIDKELDNLTDNPGRTRLEKMIGGQYLGRLILMTLQKMATESIISAESAESLFDIKELSLEEVSAFMEGKQKKNLLRDACFTPEDTKYAETIIDRLIERAAKLSVLQIVSIADKKNKEGTASGKPLCISADGSTFNKLYSFRTKFDFWIQKMITEERKRKYQVFTINHATILGAAIAALTCQQ